MNQLFSLPEETLEQAIDFDALEAAFAAPSASASACRAVLSQANERLKQRFFGGAPVAEIVRLRAACIDEVMLRAWRYWGLADSEHTLLAVGGFETGTPSEDLATGIRLTAAGWRLLFVPEKLSAGMAPLTIAAFARQRCRWASGTLQTLRTGANPLLIQGLNPIQRLAFLEGILHWLNVLPQLVLLLMPLSLGVLGIAPLRVSGSGLLQMALPLYGAQLVLARWFTAHSRTALTSELYRLVVLLPLVGAVLATLRGRPLPFRVTPKALASGRQSNPEPRLLLPLLALLSLQLVALFNLLAFASGVRLDLLPESTATLALGVGWALVNVLLLLAALRCCWDRPRSDAVPWLAWREAVQLAGQPAQLVALSEAGLELELERTAPRLGQDLELTASDGRHWSLRVEACRGRRLGCSWAPIAAELEEERKKWLQQRLYRRDGQWPTRRAPAEPLALAVILTRLLRPLAAETWLERSLLPANPPYEQHGAVMAKKQL